MDRKQFLDTLSSIGTCESETDRRSMLADLTTEAEALFDSAAELTTLNETLTADNETLRAANMKLFLQVGSNKTDSERRHDTTGISEEEEKPKRKIDDLFDENGGLK